MPRERTPVRGRSIENIGKRLKAGKTVAELKAAADNYATEVAGQTKCFYVVSNFYGRAAYYKGYLPGVWTPPETPPSDPGDAHARKLEDQRTRQASQGACP